ncbi:MAG: hypothetical protein AMXMBFR84_43830 [Candidatus Hydrogenedentota bacterium]
MVYSDRPYQTFGPAPELPADLEWVNVSEPLTLTSSRGKVVLLLFWAQSNIHCIHVIDDIKHLMDLYGGALVLMGVHTPKYPREYQSDALQMGCRKYGIEFAVANDCNSAVWKQYGATAWPTLCVVDPEGRVAAAFAGEGHRNDIEECIEEIVSFHRREGQLHENSSHQSLNLSNTDANTHMPAKLAVDETTGDVFISDSAYHRILWTDQTGRIKSIIGNGSPVLKDGTLQEAGFCRPMGLALGGSNLYVADSGNHAIRIVDLKQRMVSTFGGSGLRGNVYTMTGGTGSLLSSPQDLILIDGTLYIAMAGSHQIWRASIATANFRPFAGSGILGLKDGPGSSAHLAQPSGIAAGRGILYVADAESSALRAVDLRDEGSVHTLVGTGLYSFGDSVGSTAEARLQHPTGVSYHDGKIYVADSYNHTIKIVYPATKQVERFALDHLDTGLLDPTDIVVACGRLHIADTGNGRVVVLNLEDNTPMPFELV